MASKVALLAVLPSLCLCACSTSVEEPQVSAPGTGRIRVIIDSDANNELDDQHALAYALFSDDVFEVEGITVNRTYNGGDIDQHTREAERIVALCGREGEVPIFRGASGTYDEILPHIEQPDFDGYEAVNFIIERAMADDTRPLVLLPVGKLTNIALALAIEPAIANRVRIVWLGSNYPLEGEYNLVNDTTSVNPVLESAVPFEMAVVRYGRYSGTAAVQTTQSEVRALMPGLGPQVDPPVEGRHGQLHDSFGDYSVSLFEHIGDQSRALFDMAAVAVVKNPDWAELNEVSGRRLSGEEWVEDPSAPPFMIWENFNTSLILEDFFETVRAAGGD